MKYQMKNPLFTQYLVRVIVIVNSCQDVEFLSTPFSHIEINLRFQHRKSKKITNDLVWYTLGTHTEILLLRINSSSDESRKLFCSYTSNFFIFGNDQSIILLFVMNTFTAILLWISLPIPCLHKESLLLLCQFVWRSTITFSSYLTEIPTAILL